MSLAVFSFNNLSQNGEFSQYLKANTGAKNLPKNPLSNAGTVSTNLDKQKPSDSSAKYFVEFKLNRVLIRIFFGSQKSKSD